MNIIHIFLLGFAILIGALVLNIIAHRLGILTWYDFINAPGKANIVSYIWLFILYPLSLGAIAYVASNFLQ